MFIRQKKSKISTSVQIVKSVREGKKISQHIIRHIGVVKNNDANYENQLSKMMILADKMKSDIESREVKLVRINTQDQQKVKYVRNGNLVDVNDMRIIKNVVDGIDDVYGFIYKKIGFNSLLGGNKKYLKISNHLFDTVMARIYNPLSKLATSEILDTDFAKSISVDQIYNMMDKIDDGKIDQIKKLGYDCAANLLGGRQKIKVLFYDVTTIYFESFIEDELKQYGYSKDMKFNQSQIMLSVVVTEDGLPIDYNLYPGSTFEGHTLKDSVDAIREKYHNSDVTIVADRGMLNRDNIDLLEDSNISYIIGSKLKTLTKDLKNQILDIDSFERIGSDMENVMMVKEIKLSDNKKLVVNYSSKRAAKDKADRDKAIAKLQKKLSKTNNPKDLISNYGYQKYVTVNDDTKNCKFTINYQKIKEEEKWDGIHGIITNNLNLSPSESISQYKGLWQIEDTFRLSKTNLKIRPIYHYTPNRIKAHIAISFIALVCIRYAEYIIKTRSLKISPAQITKILSATTSTIIQDQKTQKIFAIPKVSKTAEYIYKLLDLPYRKKAYYPN